MDTEAINTWGVCLSVKTARRCWQGDTSWSREPAQRGGHNAGLLWAESGREGQDPKRQCCGQHLPPARDRPHLSSSPLGPGRETGPHSGLTPPSRHVALSPRSPRGQHTAPPPAGPRPHRPHSEQPTGLSCSPRPCRPPRPLAEARAQPCRDSPASSSRRSGLGLALVHAHSRCSSSRTCTSFNFAFFLKYSTLATCRDSSVPWTSGTRAWERGRPRPLTSSVGKAGAPVRKR